MTDTWISNTKSSTRDKAGGVFVNFNSCFQQKFVVGTGHIENYFFVGDMRYDYAHVDIKADFDETLSLSSEVTTQNFKFGFIPSLINAVLNLFSPML